MPPKCLRSAAHQEIRRWYGQSAMNTESQPPATHRKPARELTIDAEQAGRRLDKYLRAELKGVPAGLLFRLLRKGKLRVNGARTEQNYRLKEGDLLNIPPLHIPDAIPPPPLPTALLDQISRSVVHEDDRLIVINKPADIAVHVGTGVNGGVIEALRQLRPDAPDLELAHRLDRDTSGLLMVTKSPAMLRHLQQILREDGPLGRYYLTLVHGAWPGELREVAAPLLRTERSVIADPNGQDSLTRFSVRRRFGSAATLIQAQLITGRKHQIRVHTGHVGHPIAGDPKYGNQSFNQRLRQLGANHMFLHASQLDIPLPEGGFLKVTAPVPPVWDRAFNTLASRKPSRPTRGRQSRRR